MSAESRAYLRSYAQRQAAARSTQPARQPDESVEAYARRIGADPGPSRSSASPAAPDAPTVLDQPTPDQPTPDEQPQAPDAPGQGRRLGGGLAGAAADRTERLRERVASLPTPGGAGALLLIVLLFIFLIVPVSAGYTRAQLFWLTLLGRTSLPSGSAGPTGASTTSGGSSSPSSGTRSSSSSSGQLAATSGASIAAQSALNTVAPGLGNLLVLPTLPSSQSFTMPNTVAR